MFHLDNIENWERLFSNLENIIRELNNNKEKFIIDVLVHSKAINGYVDNNIIERVKHFENDVTFVGCKNSFLFFDIDTNKLYNKIQITNVGVYYLTVKQEEGFSYIKI